MPSPLDLLMMPTPALPMALTLGFALRRAKWGKDRTHGIAHTLAVAKQRVYGHAHGPQSKVGSSSPVDAMFRAYDRAYAATRVGASSDTIAQANSIIVNSTDWNAAQRQSAVGIGILETDLGVGGSWLKPDGTPSYNWGGLMGSGTDGFIVHGDVNPDGSPIEPTPHFKAFHTMQEAFDAFRATWTRGDVAGLGHPDIAHEEFVDDPASRGDALGIATTMYAHGYFGGVGGSDQDKINKYATAIVNGAKQVAAALGEPLAVQYSNPSPIAGIHLSGKTLWIGWGLLATAAGVTAWFLGRR